MAAGAGGELTGSVAGVDGEMASTLPHTKPVCEGRDSLCQQCTRLDAMLPEASSHLQHSTQTCAAKRQCSQDAAPSSQQHPVQPKLRVVEGGGVMHCIGWGGAGVQQPLAAVHPPRLLAGECPPGCIASSGSAATRHAPSPDGSLTHARARTHTHTCALFKRTQTLSFSSLMLSLSSCTPLTLSHVQDKAITKTPW